MPEPPPRRQPTLDEVAERAGVSRTAASRVINNARHVSQEKREAVQRAIRDLGYIPNPTARALATKQVGSVVLAVSADDPSLWQDPFYAQAIVGVSSALEETDFGLTLILASSAGGQAKLRAALQSHSAAGVMLMALHGDDPLSRLASQADTPVVFGGRPLNFEPPCYVDYDNRGGGRLAAEHVIGIGRRRVATITGPLDTEPALARYHGFRDAMAVAGLDASRVAHGDFTQESGAVAMRQLLDAYPDLDAVVAASDNTAIGALRILATSGRAVPADVAVTGFDDHLIARYTNPPLTTVHQPIQAFGREVARMLLALIDGEQPTPLILPARLVIRESTVTPAP